MTVISSRTTMGFKTTMNNIYWTDLELLGLVEDEDACVQLERIKKHVALQPFNLTDLNAAFREILGSSLNSYDSELNGLVLAYKNPKLLSPFGDTMYDTFYVHVDIEADFYIFRPEVGKSLKGFVNKKGTNHVGILLHKAFNVSVPQPEEEEDQEDWPGNCVEIGQEVRFTLEEIDYNTRLPYIRGSFNKNEYLEGCKLFNNQVADTCESEFQSITRNSFSENGTDIKKKFPIKTENKHIVFDSDSEVEINPEDELEKKPLVKKLKIKSDDAEESVKSPKKRKRKSTLSFESDSEQLSQENSKDKKIKVKENLLFNSSELQDVLSKKHKKKSDENNESSENTEDDQKQKSFINKLLENGMSSNLSDTESNLLDKAEKKRKKKIEKDKISYETDEETMNKSEIKNLINNSLNTSNDKESDESLVKTQKKKKKKARECIDTEDEKEYKSTINKSVTQKSKLNNSFEAESESESPNIPKTKSKKRKRSYVDTSIPNDTEDEKNYKKSLKDLSKQLDADKIDTEFEVPRSPPKKKKKKHELETPVDTEDEKNYKKSLIKSLTQNTISEEDDNEQFKKPKQKKKKKIVDDDTLMDTEDERIYKSSLKKLVQQNLENNQEQNEIESSSPEKKKSIKKRKLSKTETQEDFDPSLVKVKVEPESDVESRYSVKKNHKR